MISDFCLRYVVFCELSFELKADKLRKPIVSINL